MLIMENIPVGR